MLKETFEKIKKAAACGLAVFFTFQLILFAPAPASALTAAEVKPAIFKALGREVPQKQLSAFTGELTRADALRLSLEAMGWGFVIKALDQIG
ncbi:MAG: hypothetical protein ACLUEQ_11810, partial [Cloacibacillus evryensis]